MTRQKTNPPKYTRNHTRRFDLRWWFISPFTLLGILIILLVISALRSGSYIELILAGIILLFLIAAGVSLLLGRQISRRIERVTHAAEQVSQGNLTIRIDDHSHDEIGRLSRAFNRMVENLDQLHRSRDLLSRTMSPAVRQSLIEKGLDFRGITQDVCILFIDIWDFTRITEGYNTEQLVFFLNDYYTTIASQVHLGGGIIGKYGGDSILAYFGAPEPAPISQSATAALLTSLALHDAIEQLSDRWIILGLPQIRVGMGLSLGPAVAGPIGTEKQFEYTIIGNAVNLASRLQDLTRSIEGFGIILTTDLYNALEGTVKNQIRVVDRDAYEILDSREKAHQPVQFVDLGLVSVKGKRGPVHVYGIPDVDNK
ncbi:MAG: HAMP domain-containing protein [Anaerolineae bacterium]|nr:HAMP domain-containing protein [Anaerolineae bacterium]